MRWMGVEGAAPATVARWRDTLSSDELARAERFRFESDRSAYIGTHALLRALLARVGPLAAAEWRFVAGQDGKPELDPALASPLRFNVSRGRGLVAAAVAHRHDVGVDVEGGRRAKDFTDVASRFFTPEESALVRQEAPDGGRDAFLRLWTLKEAVIKATGEGLRRPLDSFVVTLDPPGVTFAGPSGVEPGMWQLFQVQPAAEHVLAVAVRRAHGPAVTLLPAGVAPSWPIRSERAAGGRPRARE